MNLSKRDFDNLSISSIGLNNEDQKLNKIEVVEKFINSKKLLFGYIFTPILFGFCRMLMIFLNAFTFYHLAILIIKKDNILAASTDPIMSDEALLIGFTDCLKKMGAVSIIFFIVCSFSYGLSNYFCEKFLHKVRMYFSRRLMYMDSDFFDKKENTPSKIGHLLNSESENIREMIMSGIPRLLQLIFEFGGTYVICF